MKKITIKKLLLWLVVCCCTRFTYAQIWNTPQGIREIPVTTLNDIAMASVDAYGPVIYYNPNVCQQAGPYVTAFFEAHEYGHHVRGHIIKQAMNANNPYAQFWLSKTMENDADAYACQYWVTQGNKLVIQAWVQFMYNSNGPGDYTHAPSQIRAQNVSALYSQLTGMNLFP